MNNISNKTSLSEVDGPIHWGENLRNFNHWMKENFSGNEIIQGNLVDECEKFRVFIKNFEKSLNEDALVIFNDFYKHSFVKKLAKFFILETNNNLELRDFLAVCLYIQYPGYKGAVNYKQTIMDVFYDELCYYINKSLSDDCGFIINKNDRLLKSIIIALLKSDNFRSFLENKLEECKQSEHYKLVNFEYFDSIIQENPNSVRMVN